MAVRYCPPPAPASFAMPRASATALDAGPASADLDTSLPLGRIRLALFLAGFATFSLLYSVPLNWALFVRVSTPWGEALDPRPAAVSAPHA